MNATPDRYPDQDAILFTVHGVAVPGGSKTPMRFANGQLGVRDSSGSRGRTWRRQVAQVAADAMDGRPAFDGPLTLIVTFSVTRPKAHLSARGGTKPSAPRYPTVRPDTTKLLRALEDALTGIVWRDDAQVVYQVASKQYGDAARVDVLVHPMAQSMGQS